MKQWIVIVGLLSVVLVVVVAGYCYVNSRSEYMRLVTDSRDALTSARPDGLQPGSLPFKVFDIKKGDTLDVVKSKLQGADRIYGPLVVRGGSQQTFYSFHFDHGNPYSNPWTKEKEILIMEILNVHFDASGRVQAVERTVGGPGAESFVSERLIPLR